MVFGCILLIAAIALGEYAVFKIVSNNKSRELGLFSGKCFDVLIGAIIYEVASLDMQFAKYTWEGELTNHETFFYFLRYFGLFLIVAGAMQMLILFYEQYLKKNKQQD